MPFGIAFYPPGPNPTHVYVGNTNSVVRFPYQNGDPRRRDRPRSSSRASPAAASGLAAAATGRATSSSQQTERPSSFRSARVQTSSDDDSEKRRADILAFDPDGSNERIYAWGIRNAVGLAIHPQTGQAMGLGQRARRPGRSPGPRLRHARRGRRVLRLALVLYRRPPRPTPQGQAPRAQRQGDRARRARAVALRIACA